MKMSKYFVACEDCFECIAKKSTNAGRLWLDLCDLSTRKGLIFKIKCDDFIELRTLERLGFLCTTEEKEHLIIKMYGHGNTVTGEDYFCPLAGKHDHN